MAEISMGYYTLVDLAKWLAPGDNEFLKVAETLARKNPIVKEAPIAESNQALTHVGSRQSTLPTISFRAVNEGVSATTHAEKPIQEPMALMEALSKVDVELCRLGPGRPEEVRSRIDSAHLEAMTQKYADTIFNGSLADDEKSFNGFKTRFNSLTHSPNDDSTWPYNVYGNGGTGDDLCSIYVVEWGLNKCHLIYPKGTQAGIEIKFLGEQLVKDSGGTKEFLAYVTDMKWRAGLFVPDERCVQRIANIESDGADNIFDDDLLIEALNNLPDMGENPATRIYVNRTIRTQMDIRVKDKNNVNYINVADAFGKPVLYFRGVPVQVCDALSITESAVS